LVGGMKVVQLSSVLTSVPVLFITIILAISLLKWIQEDFGERLQPPVLGSDDRLEVVQGATGETKNAVGNGVSGSR
jgi:betaine/carnitine transporter, BCCT family